MGNCSTYNFCVPWDFGWWHFNLILYMASYWFLYRQFLGCGVICRDTGNIVLLWYWYHPLLICCCIYTWDNLWLQHRFLYHMIEVSNYRVGSYHKFYIVYVCRERESILTDFSGVRTDYIHLHKISCIQPQETVINHYSNIVTNMVWHQIFM